MNYAVAILRRAQKELGRVPPPAFERLCAAIRELGTDPRPSGCRKLVNRQERHSLLALRRLASWLLASAL